jgi:cobyrinic acid a,c-diamide synthase
MNTFVVAGTHSGVGKTTVATGLMAALRRRRPVQGFKAGPDFIDPSFHTLATGRPSRNLDLWMCGRDTVRRLFQRSRSAINIVEGSMGLFDGALGGSSSTAELAKLLDAPVILVLDAQAMAQSSAALIHGFATYDPRLRLAGVIFNRVSSAGHYEYLRKCSPVPSLGWVAFDPSITIPERHLGLVPALEKAPDLRKLGDAVVRHLDLERLLRETRSRSSPVPTEKPAAIRARIGYARDEAFSFTYEDNLDLLRNAGAEMVPFSLLRKQLPEVDGLYLGGGFPEVHRIPRHPRLGEAVRAGMPVYAECGGLMYLVGQGLLPGRIEMTDRLQNFGYAEGVALRDSVAVRRGQKVRGHEFHYSRWLRSQGSSAYKVGPRVEGYARGNIHASYLHLHFGGSPGCVKRLIESAIGWRATFLRAAAASPRARRARS